MPYNWPLSVVGAVAAIILGIVVPRHRVLAWSERLPSNEEASLSFVGGGTWFTKWWPITATWPLVRLEQYTWGLRVGPNFHWIAWYLPTTDMKWLEIRVVRQSKSMIRLAINSAPGQWVSFGPHIDPRLISVLRENGVSLD